MTREIPHVEGVEHSFVDVDGLRMHVASAGSADGDPILCLHGWPQHWYMWRKLIGPFTEAGHRMICPDLRGLGWTDAPARGYEKHQLATDVLGLMDALGLERVKLVGHDWGGWTGYLLCAREPERFERMVALNIFPPLLDRSWAAIRMAPRLWYQVVLAAPVIGRVAAARLGGRSDRFFDRVRMGRGVWSPEERSIYLDYLAEPDRASATVQYYRTFQTRELWRVALGNYVDGRLRTPTLLIHGTADMVQDHRALRGVERHADDFTVDLVDGVGHFIVDERPELVAERTLAFLDG
jgi:pimeloyl-ACP methyl ester carboxylesterase